MDPWSGSRRCLDIITTLKVALLVNIYSEITGTDAKNMQVLFIPLTCKSFVSPDLLVTHKLAITLIKYFITLWQSFPRAQ